MSYGVVDVRGNARTLYAKQLPATALCKQLSGKGFACALSLGACCGLRLYRLSIYVELATCRTVKAAGERACSVIVYSGLAGKSRTERTGSVVSVENSNFFSPASSVVLTYL